MIIPSTQSDANFPVFMDAENQFATATDGTRYLDFTGANNTVILGHKKFDFNVPPNFPGKSIYEDDLSDLINRELSIFRQYRYFKNGTDAVSCAIRLGRFLTKKNAQIAFIGYAGSNNEYISTIRDKSISVPDTNNIQFFPNQFLNNDLKIETEFDILVYESRYRDIAQRIKAKFRICDHLKSGYFGLFETKDDIDLFGKSLANGYPLSVMSGRPEHMQHINKIYYSTTFGGENTGLQAAIKTITYFKIPKNKYDYLTLFEYAKTILPEWDRLPNELIKLFWQKHKILFNGHWQIMACHTKEDIERLAECCASEL